MAPGVLEDAQQRLLDAQRRAEHELWKTHTEAAAAADLSATLNEEADVLRDWVQLLNEQARDLAKWAKQAEPGAVPPEELTNIPAGARWLTDVNLSCNPSSRATPTRQLSLDTRDMSCSPSHALASTSPLAATTSATFADASCSPFHYTLVSTARAVQTSPLHSPVRHVTGTQTPLPTACHSHTQTPAPPTSTSQLVQATCGVSTSGVQAVVSTRDAAADAQPPGGADAAQRADASVGTCPQLLLSYQATAATQCESTTCDAESQTVHTGAVDAACQTDAIAPALTADTSVMARSAHSAGPASVACAATQTDTAPAEQASGGLVGLAGQQAGGAGGAAQQGSVAVCVSGVGASGSGGTRSLVTQLQSALNSAAEHRAHARQLEMQVRQLSKQLEVTQRLLQAANERLIAARMSDAGAAPTLTTPQPPNTTQQTPSASEQIVVVCHSATEERPALDEIKSEQHDGECDAASGTRESKDQGAGEQSAGAVRGQSESVMCGSVHKEAVAHAVTGGAVSDDSVSRDQDMCSA